MSDIVAANSNAPQPPRHASPRPGRRVALALALLLSLIAAAWFGWHALQPSAPAAQTLAEHSLLKLDLTRPDALIESASLAQLPRDLLRIAVLRDALTEDFVFYYETNADRLGLAGALRRIAYEHELDLSDRIIQELLDQPADIAMWRGADGKLSHALMLLGRGALAKFLQPLASVAASDSQMSQIGALEVRGVVAPVPVYRLRYNYDRSILFATHADRLLLLTSAGMLQESEETDSAPGRIETEVLAKLLTGTGGFAERFGLKKREATHRLSFSGDYLALGYGQFVPQFAGLRFEMDGLGWSSHLALNTMADTARLDFTPLWQAMPLGASVCAAAPVSATALRPLLTRLTEHTALATELATQLNGPLALCWYGKSRLHTPLLVTRLGGAENPAVDEQLGSSFDRVVGAFESEHVAGRFPVERKGVGVATLWQRVVGSSFGLHPASDLEQSNPENTELEDSERTDRKPVDSDAESPKPDDAGSLAAVHFFRVSLARHGDTLLFSLDDALVDQALATLEHRFPPLAEQLPSDAVVPAYVAADGLAALMELETLSSLPEDVEAVFRNAAERALLPKLRALGLHGRYAVTLPADATAKSDWTWLPLRWNAL